MAINVKYKNTNISIGDKVRVIYKIKEQDKTRLQSFDGILIAIKGRKDNYSITVRRIGDAQIGIERIFLLSSPSLEKIEILKKSGKGVRRAKLYYIRGKSKKEIEKIYSGVDKIKKPSN